ncbi:hypothetical protein ACFL1M_03615 [Patescibacteria group bacterium]
MNLLKSNSFLIGTMLFLSIPTAAIVISNGAIPGDPAYPIKTTVEKIATTLLSPSYDAKSDLEIKLVQRRIEENQQLLLSSGSTEGLELLVAQAEAAKEYILQSGASEEIKQEAVSKLVTTLKQSQQILQEQKTTIARSNPQVVHKTVYETKYETKTVYVNNPTVSQGNSPQSTPTPTSTTQTQTTQEAQDTTNEIEDTQGEIEDIIDDLGGNNGGDNNSDENDWNSGDNDWNNGDDDEGDQVVQQPVSCQKYCRDNNSSHPQGYCSDSSNTCSNVNGVVASGNINCNSNYPVCCCRKN